MTRRVYQIFTQHALSNEPFCYILDASLFPSMIAFAARFMEGYNNAQKPVPKALLSE